MQAWLAHSLTRYYPASPAEVRPTLELDMARGERCSLQAVLRTDQAALTVTVTVNAPAPLAVRVRRVGYVPMPHFNTETPLTELEGVGYLPGLVPDPLFPESQAQVGPYETQAFWLTITPPREAAPGRYPLTVTLTPTTGDPITLTATVIVHPTVLPERQDFPVTHWFYADALHDWYQCELFDDRFWSILGRYLENLVAHGQDTLYVPIFTPPLDGVKRPTQLLNVHRTGERYQFDWTLVRRWIAVARAHGIRYFEWTHLFTQWGAAHAIRIYAGHGEDETLLWPADTGAVSATYRTFLAQLLPELKRFLDEEGLLTNSFFHLSDEPLGEQHLQGYRAARQLLHELAPWMRVMDALSHIDFALQGLTDIPIPVISSTLQFVQAGIPCWTYFAGAPRGRYLNRLPDTPLVKVRMSGWLFYRTQVHGFLYWGYNYWYHRATRTLIDPFTVLDAGVWPEWTCGGPFLVYPGPDGPIDSIRWEVFAESLQDYALLQAASIDPDDNMLAAIVNYEEFPRDAEWILSHRSKLLSYLDQLNPVAP